ncbi:carbamoyltransferase C-terminal domain-containing protein [Micromonospora parva]|uniref:carbamoyltransferase family protein n=1 Tax=Micromonospora parva TaxID=1464048 RepID=UPI0033C67B02
MKSNWILGINPGEPGYNHHDPAAALYRDGRLMVAAEEERFTRIKGAPGVFPTAAVDFCLAEAGISVDDLDAVAVGYDPDFRDERLASQLSRIQERLTLRTGPAATLSDEEVRRAEDLGRAVVDCVASHRMFGDSPEKLIADRLRMSDPTRVAFVGHHFAHAASAYYPSPFDDAVVVVVDGVGEVSSSTSWAVRSGRWEPISDVRCPNSLGYFYAAMTDYLGFEPFEGEGKLMALAPYGSPDPLIRDRLAKVAILTSVGYDVSDLVADALRPRGMGLDLSVTRTRLTEILGRPPAARGEARQSFYENVAWAAQNFLERAMLDLVARAVEATGIRDLAVAGGVFLNCRLNQVIRESGVVDRMFVQPAAGDAGLALGSALAVAAERSVLEREPMRTLALGPKIQAESDDFGDLPVSVPEDLIGRVAGLLAEGKTVMWCEGRAEFGPRGLCHRSILADPRAADMVERVNSIKNRETWRPFAPVVLAEYASDVLGPLDPTVNGRFMIESFDVQPSWREKLAAVLHQADGTARVQILSSEDNPTVHRLLTRFHHLTGVPALMNTSCNDRGEPLMDSAANAIRLWRTSAADALVINQFLLLK